MTLLSRGVSWFGTNIKSAAGRSIVYRRGSGSGGLTAAGAMHMYEVQGSDGISTEVHVFDWTIVAADLIVNGEMITPRRGDQIHETLGTKTVIWEVLDISDTRPAVEWLDSAGSLFLVHTKQVA